MNLKKSKRNIEVIYLHCTATEPGKHVSVEAIRRYHVDVRGWSDIGYHYVVRPDGGVVEGRDVDKSGAHVRGDNEHSIGVCMVGNWDIAVPERDDPQIWETGILIARLCEIHDLTQWHVAGERRIRPNACLLHRDAHLFRPFVPNPHKSCPGNNISTEQFNNYVQWHFERLGVDEG